MTRYRCEPSVFTVHLADISLTTLTQIAPMACIFRWGHAKKTITTTGVLVAVWWKAPSSTGARHTMSGGQMVAVRCRNHAAAVGQWDTMKQENTMNESVTIVHYARCWECMFGQHFDPPERHDWAGPEDLEHDPSVKGQPCACACGTVRESHVDMVEWPGPSDWRYVDDGAPQ